MLKSTTTKRRIGATPKLIQNICLRNVSWKVLHGSRKFLKDFLFFSLVRSGLSHPDPVVETSSLSSVMPPDVTYHFSIPEQIIDTGKLSALQLEAIIYACQQHEQSNPNGERVGYLIGERRLEKVFGTKHS